MLPSDVPEEVVVPTTRTPQEKLHDDLVEVLKHQSETAQYQQEIRDRWFRFYLLLTGAALSVLAAVITFQARSTQANRSSGLLDALTSIVSALLPSRELDPATAERVLASQVFGTGFLLLFVLGGAFLLLYMFQTVNYHLNYLTIARVYEVLGSVHDRYLSDNRWPRPFAYGYGRYTSLSLRNSELGSTTVSRLLWIMFDKRLLGADFVANCIYVIIMAVCLSAALVCWTGRSGFYFTHLHTVLIVLFFFFLALRQLTQAVLFGLAFADYEKRWPSGQFHPVTSEPMIAAPLTGRASLPDPLQGHKVALFLVWRKRRWWPRPYLRCGHAVRGFLRRLIA